MFGGICGIDNSGNSMLEYYRELYGRYINCKDEGKLSSKNSGDRSGSIIGAMNTKSHVIISNE